VFIDLPGTMYILHRLNRPSYTSKRCNKRHQLSSRIEKFWASD